MEEFSSFGPAGSAAQIASISGVNHNAIGTQYDGYTGGVSAPVLNSDVTTYVGVEVRSIVPDGDEGSEDSPKYSTQDAQAEDESGNN